VAAALAASKIDHTSDQPQAHGLGRWRLIRKPENSDMRMIVMN